MSVRNEKEFLLETTEQTVAELTDAERTNPTAAASMVMASLHASVEGTQLAELRRIALEKTTCYGVDHVANAPEEEVDEEAREVSDSVVDIEAPVVEADAAAFAINANCTVIDAEQVDEPAAGKVDTAAKAEVGVEAAAPAGAIEDTQTAMMAADVTVEEATDAVEEVLTTEEVDAVAVETDPGNSASATPSDVSSASTIISDLNIRMDFLIGMLDSRLSYVESMVKFARPHDGHSTLGMHRDVLQELHKSKGQIEKDAKFRKVCMEHPLIEGARRAVLDEKH
jgi:hypothetical protein